jgi:transposase
VFQVHGIDAAEKVIVRKQLRRGQLIVFFKALAPCLIGMEACATAHYWARELTNLGHNVRLMPASKSPATAGSRPERFCRYGFHNVRVPKPPEGRRVRTLQAWQYPNERYTCTQ